MNKKYMLCLWMAFCVALSGCMTKAEDIKKNIENDIPKLIQADAAEPNTTKENLRFYLPEDSTILSAKENNVSFETEYGDFVVFMNPVESEDSHTHYEIVKSSNQDVFVDETLNERNGFQFVYIVRTDKKAYEIYVGIGNVKASALVTKKGDLEPAVEQLIKVAKSVQAVSDTEAANQKEK